MHEVFLAVDLPVIGESQITAWMWFPTALAAAQAIADDRMLVETPAGPGSRILRRWTGSEGNEVIVYAAPFEQS